MTITDQERDDIESMTDDRDTVKLSDDRIVRLRIQPDDTNPFDEYDTYGKVAPVDRYDRFGERASRPDGFDGNAEKLWPPQNCDQIWWQPPKDVKRGDEGFEQLREMVKDLVAFGMCGLVLELCDGTDAYGRPIVVDTAALWGIEPFPSDEYRREIIGELLSELDT